MAETPTVALAIESPVVSWKQWAPNRGCISFEIGSGLGAHSVSRGDYEMGLALWKRLRPPICGEPPATEAMAQQEPR